MSDYSFFVNVDRCLADDKYGYFFYEKSSARCMEMTIISPSSLGDNGSFNDDVYDINTQLNRLYQRIEDYQIIFAINGDVAGPGWQHTFLSKIVSIDYSLGNSNIPGYKFVGHLGCCVSIIAPFKVKDYTRGLNNYYFSYQFNEEFNCIAEELGVDVDALDNKDMLVVYINEYKENNDYSKSLVYMLERYIENDAFTTLSGYIKDVLFSYFNFNELSYYYDNFCDTVAMFKIVDYLIRKPENNQNIVEFINNCNKLWVDVLSQDDSTVLQKYASCLDRYKSNLKDFYDYPTMIYGKNIRINDLPIIAIPTDKDIDYVYSCFSKGIKTEERKSDTDKIINSFLSRMSPLKNIGDKWETTFTQLMDYSKNLSNKLFEYEFELKNIYLSKVSHYKGQQVVDQNKCYNVDKREVDSSVKFLNNARENVLKNLKSSQVAPRILYQNQLNMENKVIQTNENVSFYISCIKSISAKSFIFLILTLIILLAIGYCWLQPNVFFGINSYYAALYLAIILFIMACGWVFPVIYFKTLIKRDLKLLKKGLSEDLINYNKNAEKIRSYVNYCNQLCYIDMLLSVNYKALNDQNRRIYAWDHYKKEAQTIVERVNDFKGIIDEYSTYKHDSDDPNVIMKYPKINKNGTILDVSTWELYWPVI